FWVVAGGPLFSHLRASRPLSSGGTMSNKVGRSRVRRNATVSKAQKTQPRTWRASLLSATALVVFTGSGAVMTPQEALAACTPGTNPNVCSGTTTTTPGAPIWFFGWSNTTGRERSNDILVQP